MSEVKKSQFSQSGGSSPTLTQALMLKIKAVKAGPQHMKERSGACFLPAQVRLINPEPAAAITGGRSLRCEPPGACGRSSSALEVLVFTPDLKLLSCWSCCLIQRQSQTRKHACGSPAGPARPHSCVCVRRCRTCGYRGNASLDWNRQERGLHHLEALLDVCLEDLSSSGSRSPEACCCLPVHRWDPSGPLGPAVEPGPGRT